VRLLVATLLVAGCGFEHGQLGAGGGDDDPKPDAGQIGPGGDASVQPTPKPRTCAFPDPTNLKLCLEFDDGILSPAVRDGSAGLLDATASGVKATMRGSSPAVTVDSSSSMDIAESPKLDITGAITIEAWIRPASNQNAAVVLNDSQYMLAITQSQHVACSMGGNWVYSDRSTALAPGVWHHIACTVDGSQVRAYVDGSTHDCGPKYANLGTNGTQGTTIAPNFTGDVDGVRIYSRDLGNELCAHAGLTECQRDCQSQTNDGGFGFGH